MELFLFLSLPTRWTDNDARVYLARRLTDFFCLVWFVLVSFRERTRSTFSAILFFISKRGEICL
jgi:hypothetical protein